MLWGLWWALLVVGGHARSLAREGLPPFSHPLTFHNAATRSAFTQFIWPDNHMRHRNALFIHCAGCSEGDQAAYKGWVKEEAARHSVLLAHITLPALVAGPSPPCAVLWLGAGPAAVYAEAHFLLNVAAHCPASAMVTADPDAGRSSFSARYHVIASAEELCSVQLGKSRFKLLVVDGHTKGYNDNLATAFKCISGALKPDVQVLVSGPRPLADPDAAALALRPLPLPANVSQGCLGLPDAEEPCVWLYAPDPARQMEQTPYRPRPVTAIAPSVTHADVRLASGVRCGACQPGHAAVGQAYLNKAANLFGMAHDRQLLEGEVLAAVRAANLSFVLFAGVQPYTQKYVNYFLQAGRTLFATAELIPQGAIYGGEPHYQGTVNAVQHFVPPGTFDGFLAHGILGHGVDEEKDVREFFQVAATTLRPGGWLYLGYHLNPQAPRGRPKAFGHGFSSDALIQAARSKGFVLRGLGSVSRHRCFKNTLPGVTRNLKFCCTFLQKQAGAADPVAGGE